jgi:pimeloyl-ACP methyl ester carboxylesterase
MGSTFPKRGDYEYIRNKTASVFYDKKFVTPELIDEVYDAVNDRNKALHIVVTAKSAERQNLADRLKEIKAPTLLVWGNQDEITPPFVAEKFDELLENSQVAYIDKCGHAPMMEHPEEFNAILEKFLDNISR